MMLPTIVQIEAFPKENAKVVAFRNFTKEAENEAFLNKNKGSQNEWFL